MTGSFYIISVIVFVMVAFVFYREAVKYAKKVISGEDRKPNISRLGVLRPVLPLSLVVTVLIMLAVRYLFY
jgi:cytochrome c oxidase assembly factor CtaG